MDCTENKDKKKRKGKIKKMYNGSCNQLNLL